MSFISVAIKESYGYDGQFTPSRIPVILYARKGYRRLTAGSDRAGDLRHDRINVPMSSDGMSPDSVISKTLLALGLDYQRVV